MIKKLKTRDVVRMCQDGRAKEARKSLMSSLAASQSVSKAEEKRLLEGLLYVEVFEGHAQAALQVLKRRRALGYRNLERRMDDALETSTLLYNTGHFIEARAELIDLLRERKSNEWHGLLPALSLYVDADEKCREAMNSVLVEGARTAVKRLGIPIQVELGGAKLPKTIKAARSMYRADSKVYSGLLTQVFTERSQDGRQHVIDNLREFSESAKVDFFRDQAKQLLKKLSSQNA